MANPDMVGYTETLNQRKIFRKAQKKQATENQNHQKNTKTII